MLSQLIQPTGRSCLIAGYLKRGYLKLHKQVTQWLQARDEPQITQHRDRQGNLYYQVYDPRSGRSSYFGDASEVRYWLERRYSHPG
jgi:hypothetical protein